ncbi:MAG: hypothetical protein NTX79_01120 [Candidatus Micrarchaeota archaeon]|nr:hypothetical protein [Candidatus Micrarchaeota archaeon]
MPHGQKIIRDDKNKADKVSPTKSNVQPANRMSAIGTQIKTEILTTTCKPTLQDARNKLDIIKAALKGYYGYWSGCHTLDLASIGDGEFFKVQMNTVDGILNKLDAVPLEKNSDMPVAQKQLEIVANMLTGYKEYWNGRHTLDLASIGDGEFFKVQMNTVDGILNKLNKLVQTLQQI